MSKNLTEQAAAGVQPQVVDAIVLLTVKDVAKLMKMSVRSVWRLRAAGTLNVPVIRIGRSVRIDQRDIVHFLV